MAQYNIFFISKIRNKKYETINFEYLNINIMDQNIHINFWQICWKAFRRETL